jgi:hypothetical protein
MRQFRCLLAGLAGAMIAILAMVGALVISFVVISLRISTSQGGEIGWDPVSLWRQQPLIAILGVLLITGIIAWGFLFGYRLQARRIRA